MSPNYDIAIIGGGPVGTALALALQESRLKICILEARPAHVASTDARALALSYGSHLLLDRLGAWQQLHDVSAITRIHISQRHSFGRTQLQAEDMKVPALGYVLPYAALQNALSDSLQQTAADMLFGASVTQLQGESGQATISYQQDDTLHTLQTRLAVVAGLLFAFEHEIQRGLVGHAGVKVAGHFFVQRVAAVLAGRPRRPCAGRWRAHGLR